MLWGYKCFRSVYLHLRYYLFNSENNDYLFINMQEKVPQM